MVKLRGQNNRKLNSEINIVPLLDVMLVLLLIFMATTPIITQNIEVYLPDSRESNTINNNENFPVIIEVTDMGQYSIVVGKDRMNKLSPEQVIKEAQRYLNANIKTVFLIGGSKDVPYDEIIKVINLLRSLGIKSVGLMTNPI